MRLFRRQPAEPIEELALIDDAEAVEDEAPAEPEYGPEVLREGPLLARWFILFELDREMKRASRHERALSIMVLMPYPTLGYVPSDAAMLAAATAAQKAMRTTDLIGWLPNGGILVVMPETDKDGAAAAVNRWRDAMYMSTIPMGAVRWKIATRINAWEYESADQLLDELWGDLDLAEAA